MKDLLRTSHLSAADLTRLLDLAAAYRAEPHRDADLLRHETVGLYFAKPSTRTRISFATAVAHLGAVPIAAQRRRSCSSAAARRSRTPRGSSAASARPS